MTKRFKVKGAPVLQARMAAAAAAAEARVEALLDAAKGPRRAIKAMGLPWPAYDKKHKYDVVPFPAKITDLGHGEVRDLMSYYTAFYGYANTRLGIWKAKKAIYERTLRVRREILFQKYRPKDERRQPMAAVHGRISSKPEIKKMEALLGEAEAMVAVLETVVWTYKAYSEIASREITARSDEIEIGGRNVTRIRRRNGQA